MIDPSKAVLLTSLPNIQLIASGSQDVDIGPSWTTGTVLSYTLYTSVDTTKHFAFIYANPHKSDLTTAYARLPNGDIITWNNGANRQGDIDYTYEVDSNGNLILKIKLNSATAGSGTFVSANMNYKFAWYLADMTYP